MDTTGSPLGHPVDSTANPPQPDPIDALAWKWESLPRAERRQMAREAKRRGSGWTKATPYRLGADRWSG